jgi:hypothetical protein
MSSLSSIALFGVPLPWIGNIVMILTLIGYLEVIKKDEFYFLSIMTLLVTMSCIISFYNWGDYSGRVPSKMTTSYGVFISLRYVGLLMFIASVITTWRLSKLGYDRQLHSIIITIGTYSAIYGLYVYIAQLYGLPELLPRSRLGTDLQAQSTVFTYQFHRAMGSFREPSHLAEWLIVPLILSFSLKGKYNRIKSALMGLAMVLTGSLTGLLSIFISGLIMLLIKTINLLKTGTISKVGFTSGVFGLILFSGVIIYVNLYTSGAFYSQISDRIGDLVTGGIMLSNRSYVYIYVVNVDWSLFGVGLGNSLFDFGWNTVGSFLSIYINILYSLGSVGLLLLTLVFVLPLYQVIRFYKSNVLYLLWAYLSWLVAFAVHSEEFNVMFGVTYGLLMSASSRIVMSGRP